MHRRKKEKIVKEKYGEIKTVSKDNGKKILFIVRKNGKQITTATRDGLIVKPYNTLESETSKDITVEQLWGIPRYK